MNEIAGSTWFEDAFKDAKFGEVDGKPWTWWDDPWTTASSGWEAFAVYDEDSEVIQDPDIQEQYKHLLAGEV